jgi:hypothetical protein
MFAFLERLWSEIRAQPRTVFVLMGPAWCYVAGFGGLLCALVMLLPGPRLRAMVAAT